MSQEIISMTKKELVRYEIINNLINKKIKAKDAAKQIGVSVRQAQRMKKVVKQKGAIGLIHKNRGRESNNKLNSKVIEKTENLLQEKYYFCGPTFAKEKLEENENIKIGKETLRGLMTELGIWKPKLRKQPKKKFKWRARKENYGEMEQFDGSYHIWFGDKEYCLLLAVDDATGKITYALFDINESIKAVFKFWLSYFEKHGLPLSIYLDKFSTYKVNHKNAVDNKDMITQFERAMNQVDVRVIKANTPQAKGRVERMNETLQDRLVKELRLTGITTIEEANKFLEEYILKFNKKFAVLPKRKANVHRNLDKETKEKLKQIFSIQDTRKVNNDYTIHFKKHYYQLDEVQPTTVYKKDEIIVEEHLDNEIKIRIRETYLKYTELPERPKKEIDVKLAALTKRKQSSYKPDDKHPWRQQYILSKFKKEQKVFAQK